MWDIARKSNIKKMSKEYVSALAVLIVAILQIFKIEVGNEAITGIITGVLALYLAFKRYQRGDITIGGFRK